MFVDEAVDGEVTHFRVSVLDLSACLCNVCHALGTEIVELDFIEGNDRAKALYEKFGFKVIAVKPNYCKLKDGTYQNLVYMQKYL